MEEQTIYEDNNIRLSTLRFNYRTETIPLDKLVGVRVGFKVLATVIAFICFVCSFITFFIFGNAGLFIVAVCFIFLVKAFSTYVELWIELEGEGERKLIQTSLTNGSYLFKVEDKINEAIELHKKMLSEGTFEYTDTMRFREKLRQYE